MYKLISACSTFVLPILPWLSGDAKLTSKQVAAKAAVSRSTLARSENGDPTVSFATVLNICRTLGILDRVIEATDPYETEIGRIRVDHELPQRVRRQV